QLPLDVKIEKPHRLEPTFTAIVRDAALTVRLSKKDEPVIDLDGIDLTIRVEKTGEGRLLTLDPVVIFDKRKVSPKLVNKLVHLFEPTLGDSPRVTGEISLALDKLRVPLGIPRDQLARRIEVEGKLRLDQVSTEVNTPLQKALVKLVAEMNDKHPHKVERLV